MPELPEVETTRRGIATHVEGKMIVDVRVRERRLRWPVSSNLHAKVTGRKLLRVRRRAKYLLLEFDHGTLLIHLGMSGSLRIVNENEPPGKHDHVDLCWAGGTLLRLTDPRRFGAVLWLGPHAEQHKLLAHLGPEPLSDRFSGDWLYQRARGRRVAVKQFVMDQKIVTGIGNIYANEALFKAGIYPSRQAGRISSARYEKLSDAIREVLTHAIEQGGTTLRDFVGTDGKPGYFKQDLLVYGHAGDPCPECATTLVSTKLGGRATVFCRQCQR